MRMLKLIAKSPDLSYPWGYVISDSPPLSIVRASKIIGGLPIVTVGDVVSKNFKKYYRAEMSIVDYRTRRKRIDEWVSGNHEVCTNPPGTLTEECIDAIVRLLERGEGTLVVRGEEDLLAIPVLSLCKRGFVVYGNWRGFLQVIPCTPFFRLKALGLLKKYFALTSDATKAYP